MSFSQERPARVIWGCLILSCNVALGQSLNLADARKAFDAGKWVEAEGLSRRYLAAWPESADGHYLLASTLLHEDRPTESLAEYTSAARLRRPVASDLKSVALDYVLAHDYEDADKWMLEALRLAPEDGDAWYSLGRIRYTEEKFDGAVEAFQEALKRMPRSIKVENNLGLSYEGLYEREKAMAAYHQAIEWEKDDRSPSEQPYINLGKLLVEEDQPKEGLPFLLRAEELSSQDETVHVLMGKLYQKQGDLKKAQNELEQAVQIMPKDATAHFLLGRIYRSESLIEKANAEFSLVGDLYKSQNKAQSEKP